MDGWMDGWMDVSKYHGILHFFASGIHYMKLQSQY